MCNILYINNKMQINTPGENLSLNDFKWIENTKENRIKFLQFSEDELKDIQNKAVEDCEFEIAAFLRDILKDKINNRKLEQNLKQTNVKDNLASAISTETDIIPLNEDNELVKSDWEFVELWHKQKDTAKRIEEYYETNGIKNENWNKIVIDPRTIKFHDDIIFVDKIRENHFFKQENWEIKEIPLIQDKMQGKCAIRNIYKVWDYYKVDLCFLNEKWWIEHDYNNKEKSLRFIIDKNGNYLQEMWKQTWTDNFYLNSLWAYEFEKDLWNGKITRTIFNKNMGKIAEFEDNKEYRYNIQYCDDDVCVCSLRHDSWYSSYVVFSKNQIVWEWTEKDLESNEYMQGFLKKKEEEKKANDEQNRIKSIPFEERYMDKNHCKIVYKNDEKSDISIENDKWETIFELWNIENISYIDNIPKFNTNTGDNIKINDWEKDNNILFIKITNYQKNTHKSIFINKTTWEKTEFDWFRWEHSSREWKLIRVFLDSKNAEVFDDDLNYLWIKDWEDSNLWFFTIRKEEDWKTKHYIVSTQTGKIVTEYTRYPTWDTPYFNTYEKDGKRYFIVDVPGKWISQVEIK